MRKSSKLKDSRVSKKRPKKAIKFNAMKVCKHNYTQPNLNVHCTNYVPGIPQRPKPPTTILDPLGMS